MFLYIIILAVVQGVTEFLPVSSSGHLVILKHLLGVETPGPALEVYLHAGSLLAIVLFFRNRLALLFRALYRREAAAWRYAGLLAVSMLPVLVVYPLMHTRMDAVFVQPTGAAYMLMVTGIILLTGYRKIKSVRQPGALIAVLTGLAQLLALLPGISRSGMTITVARRLGLSADDAAEFSFLMVLPLLAAAALLELFRCREGWPAEINAAMLVSGMLVSAVTGYAALYGLLKVLKSGGFHCFGWYCLAAGIAAIMII